jgi:hypothetical protein
MRLLCKSGLSLRALFDVEAAVCLLSFSFENNATKEVSVRHAVTILFDSVKRQETCEKLLTKLSIPYLLILI